MDSDGDRCVRVADTDYSYSVLSLKHSLKPTRDYDLPTSCATASLARALSRFCRSSEPRAAALRRPNSSRPLQDVQVSVPL